MKLLGKTRFVIVALLAMLLAFSLSAQTAGTGAITGTVTDSTGAVIPNVIVTATNAGTGQERTATSAADGVYTIGLLTPGSYRVKFSANGFKTSDVNNVVVPVTDTITVSRAMEIGAQSEQVTVEASVETIQTTNSTLGTTVTAQTVTALPLTTRNYTQILAFSAGVNVDVNNAGRMGNGAIDVAVNGARTAQNNYSMDGVSVTPFGNGSTTNDGVYAGFGIPNPDAIQEFKIQTSQYDAGFGRNIGANVNVVTKSGTNQFHGSGFEFLRNTSLNANEFFRNRYCGQNVAQCAGAIKPVLNQNQFGGVFGGAIKKDKLFFFASYQGTRQKNGLAQQGLSTANIPYLPGNRDNKAALRAALGAAYAGRTGALGGLAIDAAGNNISDVALNILQLKLADGSYYVPGFTDINQTSVGRTSGSSITQNGVSFVRPADFAENQALLNGDYLMSPKHTIATRWYYQPQTQTNNFAAANQMPGSIQNIERSNINGVLKLTSLVSNTMVNEAYGAIGRGVQNIFAFPTPDGSTPFKATAVGIKPINAHTDILEPMLFQGGVVSNFGATCCTSSWMATTELNFGDQLSWTKSSHTLRMGGNYHHVNWPWTFSGFSRGELNFASFTDFLIGRAGCAPGVSTAACTASTAGPNGTNGTTQSNISNCTLCLVTSPGGVVHDYRVNNASAFFQDDWKVSANLTLNAGVRWEYIGQAIDKNGDLSNTWLSLARQGNAELGDSQANGTYRGWVAPANYQKTSGVFALTGQRATILQNSLNNASRTGSPLNNFAPRFGFAWTPLGGSKFVVRGGTGFFYDTPNGNARIHSVNENVPYTVKQDKSGAENYFSSLSLPYQYADLGWGSSRFITPQGVNSALIAPFLTEIIETPTVYQYNLSVQYEFLPATVLEVGYVGNKGIRLANQLRQMNIARLASPTAPVCYVAAGATRCITNNSTANVNERVPYLGYSSVGLQQEGYDGDSRFNSLQMTLRKRMSHGFSFQAAYTLSSLFTNLSATNTAQSNNPTDMRQQWGRSLQYRPNRLAINYSWELPSGFLGSSKVGGYLFKGWNLSGVTTIQDGNPMTITDNRNGTAYSSNNAFGSNILPRAQMASGATYAQVVNQGRTADLVGLDAGSTRFLQGTMFVQAPLVPFAGTGNPREYGNSGIAIVQGPGQLNFDMSMIKNTKVHLIHEDDTIQFRAEFYNLFNHTQFALPNTTFNSGAFGQITQTSVAPRLIQFALKYTF